VGSVAVTIRIGGFVHLGTTQRRVTIELLQESTTAIGLENVVVRVGASIDDKDDGVYVIRIKYLSFRVICTSSAVASRTDVLAARGFHVPSAIVTTLIDFGWNGLEGDIFTVRTCRAQTFCLKL